jgi:hypothetical protein
MSALPHTVFSYQVMAPDQLAKDISVLQEFQDPCSEQAFQISPRRQQRFDIVLGQSKPAE